MFNLISFLLQVLALASMVFAIAGAGIMRWREEFDSDDVNEMKMRMMEIRDLFKTAQDLFICIIVWALLILCIGFAFHLSSSDSDQYEVRSRISVKEENLNI